MKALSLLIETYANGTPLGDKAYKDILSDYEEDNGLEPIPDDVDLIGGKLSSDEVRLVQQLLWVAAKKGTQLQAIMTHFAIERITAIDGFELVEGDYAPWDAADLEYVVGMLQIILPELKGEEDQLEGARTSAAALLRHLKARDERALALIKKAKRAIQ